MTRSTDEDDDASVARFLRAVAPIDRHREYHAKPRATETETPPDVDPDTDVTDSDAPVPPLDPAA